jgi:hypothetical protein
MDDTLHEDNEPIAAIARLLIEHTEENVRLADPAPRDPS